MAPTYLTPTLLHLIFILTTSSTIPSDLVRLCVIVSSAYLHFVFCGVLEFKKVYNFYALGEQ